MTENQTVHLKRRQSVRILRAKIHQLEEQVRAYSVPGEELSTTDQLIADVALIANIVAGDIEASKVQAAETLEALKAVREALGLLHKRVCIIEDGIENKDRLTGQWLADALEGGEITREQYNTMTRWLHDGSKP